MASADIISDHFNTQGIRVQENAHDSKRSRKFIQEMSLRYDKKVIFP